MSRKFHEHLDGCDQCRINPFALCADGERLLREAATAAPRPVDRSYFREAGEPAPDQPQGNEFFVISDQGVGVGKFADNGNDITLRPRVHNTENWNCQGSGPHAVGEVRLLPAGGDSNMILCRRCFDHEIAYRRGRNREVAVPFDLPTWDSLKVYEAV